LFPRIIARALLIVALAAPIACKTRLASGLNGFVCDAGTGICTPKQGPGGHDASVDESTDTGVLTDATETGTSPEGGAPDADASPPADAEDTADGDDGVGSGQVFISSPTGTVYTNGKVVIQVGFGTGSTVPTSVDILTNMSQMPLASIGAPFSFTWDTTNVPEGSYHVTARAHFGGGAVTSAPVTIIVDRTPPTVLTQVPPPNATNVDLTVPIQVTFSEALLPATVTSSTVQLSIAGNMVPAKAILSADGKTITLTLSQRQALALPATIQELLPGTITDLAGNPLVTTSWTWSAPLWLEFGSVQGGSPDLSIDSKGNLVVCTVAERGATGSHDYQVVVARHGTATAWDSSFGTPQGPQGSSFVPGPAAVTIATDDNPIVAWPEFSTGPSDIHVAKWTGTTWDQSFGTLSAEQGNNTSARQPRLAGATAGQFFVAWAEDSQMYVTSVYAARWTGTSWDLSYGGIAQIGAQQPTLGVSPAGQPNVTWSSSIDGGGLSRWTGSAWASTTFPNFGVVGLAFDSMQRPLITNTDTSADAILISAYVAASNSFPPAATAMTTAMSPSGARLAVDGLGQILLAWSDSDGTTRNVHLARFDGMTWDTSFGIISAIDGPNTPAANPALLVTPDGVPVLAWDETDSPAGSKPSAFVWKSNH
jgi:hypothetical protein